MDRLQKQCFEIFSRREQVTLDQSIFSTEKKGRKNKKEGRKEKSDKSIFSTKNTLIQGRTGSEYEHCYVAFKKLVRNPECSKSDNFKKLQYWPQFSVSKNENKDDNHVCAYQL